MDDLISRSVLKEAFSKNSIFEKITDSRGMNVLEIIDEQPTAYDVDAVVKELEDIKNAPKRDCPYNTGWKSSVECAIEIVRKGGVRE